ncbi:MAG: hypothetical protein ACR2OB_11965 [Solirubrobacteraceae bacterium]
MKKLKQAAHDANDPRARPGRPIHADQAALAVAFEQRFSSVLCHDVRVEPRKAGMLRVSLDLTPREAELVLGRLGSPAPENGILDGVVAVDDDADGEPFASACT